MVRKVKSQWMLKITAYAERLLNDLDTWTTWRRSRPSSATGSAVRRGRVDFAIAGTGKKRLCSQLAWTRSSARPTWSCRLSIP